MRLAWACFIVIVPSASGWGVTLGVPSEYATIQAGLDAASAGDTVLVAPGLYQDYETRPDVNGTLASACAFLRAGVTLKSEGGADVTTIELPGAVGFPYVVRAIFLGEECTIDGFTITGTVPGLDGVGLWHCESLVMKECIVRDIGSGGSGEGGVSSIRTNVLVDGCLFLRNRGGAVAGIGVETANVTVRNSTFDDCTSMSVRVNRPEASGVVRLEVEGCTFKNGASLVGGGGAISAGSYSSVKIVGSQFLDNQSTGGGGAIQLAIELSNGEVELRDNLFIRNRVGGASRGGAVRITARDMDITGNTFYQCSQDWIWSGGAALSAASGSVVFTNNLVVDCGGSQAVSLPGATESVLSACNVFWENPDGEAEGFELSNSDRIVDPLFCGPGLDDLTVSSVSPCLAKNSPGCGQVGALGQGCGTVSVTPATFGRIKSDYREGRP